MRKDNPACYECRKGKSRLHTWSRWLGGAKCIHCGLELNATDAAEVFVGQVLGIRRTSGEEAR